MHKINYLGLDIEIHRSKSQGGKLVIDITTHDLDTGDTYEDDVPRLIIYLNEERLETTPDGGWRIGHATSHEDGDAHIVPARSSFIPPSEYPESESDD